MDRKCRILEYNSIGIDVDGVLFNVKWDD